MPRDIVKLFKGASFPPVVGIFHSSSVFPEMTAIRVFAEQEIRNNQVDNMATAAEPAASWI